jgi:hypothetical protein
MELVRKLPYNHPYRWDGSLFGQPKLWRPTEIQLALWLDAEDTSTITLNGSTVSQWNDKSGNGRHFTQATTSLQPVYNLTAFNGMPSVSFDGIDDRMSSAQDFTANGMSWYVVCQRTSATLATQTVIGSVSGNTYLPIAASGNTTTQVFRINAINDPASLSVFLTGVMVKDKNNPPTTTRNDIFNSLGNAGILESLGCVAFASPPQIGVASGAYFLAGLVSEVVVSVNDSSTTERQIIEGYLAWKWGFEGSLQVGHPYKNLPPTV